MKMKKILALFCCLSIFLSFSFATDSNREKDTGKGGQKQQTPKMKVCDAHKQLMQSFSFDHTSFKRGNLVKSNSSQFFVNPKVLDRVSKKKGLLDVYKTINKEDFTVTKIEFKSEPFIVDSLGLGEINSDGKVIRTNKFARFMTKTEVHLRVENKNMGFWSDTCFDVSFFWLFKTNEQKVHKVYEIKAVPKQYTSAEKRALEKKKEQERIRKETQIKDSLVKWYVALPETAGTKFSLYSNDSIVLSEITHDSIRLRFEDGKYFTTKMPGLDMLFVNELGDTNTYKLTPALEVMLDGDFEIVNLDWTVGDTVDLASFRSMQLSSAKDENGSQSTLKEKLAVSVARNFATELISYAKNPTPSGKKYVESMFQDKSINVVEVSFKGDENKETVVQRIAEDYLSRLKTSTISIDINVDEAQFLDNGNSVVFPFVQVYSSETYGDSVKKNLRMRAAGDVWFVERIEVVRNTTQRIK